MKFSRRNEMKYFDLEIEKKSVQIGIFGSFQRIEQLKLCKEYLFSKGYIHTRLSLDLEDKYSPKAGESRDEYNLKISEKLIETSDIHIIYFFKNCETDKVPVNESAVQEYRIMSDKSSPDKILVLIEEKTSFSGLTRGLISRNDGYVTHMNFKSVDETFRPVSNHCLKCIIKK
ncbi:MAG: hypothetical protein JXQ82_03270 [Methanomicrobiaceae archaeon]|nr:hypothetical protein [Methanomicrobiaceae archaeon]